MMYNFLMQEAIFDVIIIGSGPAGLTSAIYTSRSFLKTLLISGIPAGGQLMTTTEVENFPGFPNGIQGPELIANLRSQAERFDSIFEEDNVQSIHESKEGLFEVKTDSGKVFIGRSIIVATGASARWLGLPSEQKLRGKGVSACATCDGFFFKNKVVAVVGGGDAAMEEASFLTKYASKVYVLVRGAKNQLKASNIMQQRALINPKVEFLYNVEVKEVLGDNSVNGLKLHNNLSGEETTLNDVQGLFVAIGHEPNTGFLKGFIELDEKGYARPKDLTKSSKAGVFLAGDVADYRYRQAITAAGSGCMAALDVRKYLSEKGIEVKTEGY